MKKTIKIGGEPYEVNYTSENAFKVLDLVLQWMQDDKHGASVTGEAIYQNDECQIDAPELIANIVDDVLKPEYLGCE